MAVPSAPPAATTGQQVAIGTLDDDIDARSLPRSIRRGGVTALTIGVDFAALGPASIEVPDGEHVLVVGPARSGRSTR